MYQMEPKDRGKILGVKTFETHYSLSKINHQEHATDFGTI